MRLAAIAAALLLATTSLAAAQPFETPEALLEAFYQPYLDGDFSDDEASFRSRALQALYDHDAEITPEGEMGAIDFDPYVNGQDFALSNFEIGAVVVTGDIASVAVSFDNFDQPMTLVYDLALEDDGWKIDDVAMSDAEYPYRLTEIFAAAAQ